MVDTPCNGILEKIYRLNLYEMPRLYNGFHPLAIAWCQNFYYQEPMSIIRLVLHVLVALIDKDLTKLRNVTSSAVCATDRTNLLLRMTCDFQRNTVDCERLFGFNCPSSNKIRQCVGICCRATYSKTHTRQ